MALETMVYRADREERGKGLSVRRILMGAAGTIILAILVTLGTIASSASGQVSTKGGWGSQSGSSSASDGASRRAVATPQASSFDETLHVISRQKNFAFLDSNPDGQRGDGVVVEGPVKDPDTNEKIGLFSARCQSVAPKTDSLYDCNITYNLHGDFPDVDSITVQGGSSNSTLWTNAVTGGSGQYANVTGEVTFQNIEGSNDVDTIFYLNYVR